MTADTKTCARCSTSKPRDGFHRNAARCDGLDTYCRLCSRAVKAALYEARRGEILDRNRSWRERSKGLISAYNREHYAASKFQDQARHAVRAAVLGGELTKSTNCNRCGSSREIQGHHHSYAREHWLDVEWLCKRCHARHHASQGAVAS